MNKPAPVSRAAMASHTEKQSARSQTVKQSHCAHAVLFHVSPGPSSSRGRAVTYASVYYYLWNPPPNYCELSRSCKRTSFGAGLAEATLREGQADFVKDSSAPLVSRRPWNKGHPITRKVIQMSFLGEGKRRKHLQFQTSLFSPL